MTVVFSIAIIKKSKFNKFSYSKFYKSLCRRLIVIIVVEKLTIGGKIEFI